VILHDNAEPSIANLSCDWLQRCDWEISRPVIYISFDSFKKHLTGK
jgi:hypothetical protein